MARRSQEDTEATRQTILKAGLSVFARDGYEAATLDAIAQEAKLSRGAIYWHHAGKPSLIEEILTEYTTPLDQYLNETEIKNCNLGCLKSALIETVSDRDAKLLTRIISKCCWQPFVSEKYKNVKLNLGLKILSILEESQRKGNLNTKLDTNKAARWLQFSLIGLIAQDLDSYHFREILESTLNLFETWVGGAHFTHTSSDEPQKTSEGKSP